MFFAHNRKDAIYNVAGSTPFQLIIHAISNDIQILCHHIYHLNGETFENLVRADSMFAPSQ